MEKLEARRRERNKLPGAAVTAVKPEREDRRQGLGDFQSRLNRGSAGEERHERERPRDQGWGDRGGRRDERDRGGRSWENPTPRTFRTNRDMDGGSMRVPNQRWDETPRARGPGGWGKTQDSRKGGWEQTPSSRSVRGGYEDEDFVNGKEWEEEQVRIDRDWYIQEDEGVVVSRSAASLPRTALIRRLGMRSTTLSHSGRTLKDRRKRRCSRKLRRSRRLDRLNTYVKYCSFGLVLADHAERR